jgi:hypothetical protein
MQRGFRSARHARISRPSSPCRFCARAGLRASFLRKFNPMPQYGTTGSGIEQGLLLDHKLLAAGGGAQYGSVGKSVK